MTDSTMISTATASAVPAIEITEIKEMKRFLLRERMWRSAMASSKGCNMIAGTPRLLVAQHFGRRD